MTVPSNVSLHGRHYKIVPAAHIPTMTAYILGKQHKKKGGGITGTLNPYNENLYLFNGTFFWVAFV